MVSYMERRVSFRGDLSESEDAEPTPETTGLLLSTFADAYRQEIVAEEDVFRTLPFFGTALGIVIAALGFAAGRLPRWTDLAADGPDWPVVLAGALFGLAVLEAGGVIIRLSQAVARRDYQRIGPEDALQARADELVAHYRGQDARAAEAFRLSLIDSYRQVTAGNRVLNQLRYRFRALAAAHLIRSLLWALAATTLIVMTDKFGILPRVAS